MNADLYRSRMQNNNHNGTEPNPNNANDTSNSSDIVSVVHGLLMTAMNIDVILPYHFNYEGFPELFVLLHRVSYISYISYYVYWTCVEKKMLFLMLISKYTDKLFVNVSHEY